MARVRMHSRNAIPARWPVRPWRGERATTVREEKCRVCGVPIPEGTEALYCSYAIGGMHSHVACGFRTREECERANRPYLGPKDDGGTGTS